MKKPEKKRKKKTAKTRKPAAKKTRKSGKSGLSAPLRRANFAKKKRPTQAKRPSFVEKAVFNKKLTLKSGILNIPKVEQGDLIHKTKIRIIGVGGGGGAIVSEIASRIKKADFYIANTDSRSLSEQAKKVKKFQFGFNITKGFGTGMNPELGEAAATDEKERIKKIFEGQDLSIIVACLGGGTSSGASHVFAKISKDLGNLTYGIFTLPFKFEGQKKMEAALAALEKAKPNVNVYTVIPNERIFEIVDKNTPLKGALSAINRRLADNLEGLIEMIYLPGLVNIDFADLKSILSGRGRLAYINSVDVEESQKEDAIKNLISSPIYPYTIRGAKGILYNIISGKDIQLSEVAQISNTISESISKEAKIIFGINQNQKQNKKLKITLLATGCLGKGFLETDLPGQKAARNTKKDIPAKNPVKKLLLRQNSSDKEENIIPKSIKPERSSAIIKKAKKSLKPAVKNKAPKAPKIAPVEVKIVKKEKKKLRSQFVSVSPNASLATKIAVHSLDDGKVRKNALQVKKEIEDAEKEFLDQEKIWDVPAILRKKKFDEN